MYVDRNKARLISFINDFFRQELWRLEYNPDDWWRYNEPLKQRYSNIEELKKYYKWQFKYFKDRIDEIF
jgi:hypothetical protein